MINNIKQSLLDQLDGVEWMDNITKSRAHEKVRAVIITFLFYFAKRVVV